MSSILKKADRLTVDMLKDAPTGTWSKVLLDAINSLVEVTDGVRNPGLEQRVGSSVSTVNLDLRPDWSPLVMANSDWKGIPSTGHPEPAVKKNDDGTAELRGCFFYYRAIPSLFISQLTDESIYPDSLMPFLATNITASAMYRGSVTQRGGVMLETGPAASDTILIPGHWRWRCLKPSAPIRLTAPVVVNHGLGSLADMRIVSCVDSTAPSVQLPHPRLAWLDQGNGSVKISNCLGLPGGKKYILKLLFIQG